MRNNKLNFLIILLQLFFVTTCNSQDKNSGITAEKSSQTELVNRQPAVAGQFYPSDPDELKNSLLYQFSNALPQKSGNVLAIITPHAGYVYSGGVAATSFNQIDNNKEYETVFLIGSSHRTSFHGASIYNKGDYITPLGTVKVDIPLAEKLIQQYDCFSYNKDAHLSEHSLEVQLPFLQYIMKKDYDIVPIVLGTNSPEMCKEIAIALFPYFYSKNLFIISTDFSHYPNYEDAVEVDKVTADAIQSNSTKNVINTINNNRDKNISNLSTSICGWTSVMTLLYMTENNPDISINPIQYKNSGDAEIGTKDRVVGYYSMTVTLKEIEDGEKAEFDLTDRDKKDLLVIARSTIEQYINENKITEINTGNFSNILMTNCGAFVTLHKNKMLRGCIGRFTADEPLYKIIQQMAISASTQDPRFPKVTPEEIDKLEIEVSVLSPMKKINSIDEIIMGKHGIYIKKGNASGTFLPQVATETGWTKEEFLGHCARDKAGIGWEGWKEADIYIYEANVFSEEDLGK
ncbi:MAG: AmmeMemoRadiSam system protein B [Bacteroidota bacterium]